MERGWKEMPPNCPRCGSTNTKFCYYNNYSLTQPRYFCKGCRRYWTKGGSLRNVPVGGGCRKSRRGNKPSLRTSSAPTATTPYPNATPTSCRRIVSAFGHVIMNSDGPSSSSSSSASTIDLAVVYANFLNPKTTQEREENQRARLPYYHHSNYHDPLVCSPLDQIPIISKANMDLALSSHEAYLEEQDDQLLLVHHHHHHHKQQVQGDHHMMQNPSSSTYNHDHVKNGALLPPLPGEEEAGMRPIFQEVVIPLEKNNNPTHDHLISYSNDHNPQTETPFSSLFNVDDGCWSPLDFSEIETPMATTRTTTTTTISQHQWP